MSKLDFALGDPREIVGYNQAGIFQLIETDTRNIEFVFPSSEIVYYNLQLLYGVGEVTAEKLVQSGFPTLRDLIAHPRWKRAAAELVRMIEAKDVPRLARYGASDLELLSFFQADEIKFIDIETVGLCNTQPVFLIGTLQFRNNHGIIRQFLARNFEEEQAILLELDAAWRNKGVIASYNGRSFDIPYLRGRMRFYQLNDEFNAFHLDLLGQTRRHFRSVLPDCRLGSVETYLLARPRQDDLPGYLAPEFYNRYQDTGDRQFIDPILKHNALDLLALADLLGIITLDFQKRVSGSGA